MSHFLQNLIGRHWKGGIDKEVMAQVQPRPKSRFETILEPTSLAQNDLTESDRLLQKSPLNSDAGSNLTQGLPNSRPAAELETNRSALDTQVTTQQSNEPTRQTDSSYQIENLNERIERLKIQLGQKSPVLETANRASSNLNNQVIEDHPEFLNISKRPNPENLFVPGELNDRIQTLLHRLNYQQSPATDNPEPVTQPDYKLEEIDKSPANGAQQGTKSISATISKFQQPDTKKKQQTIESSNNQRPSHQTGLLQIPDWLSEMQVDLNNRMQQLQTQSNLEPVVNVTIGRVEVKAVQPEATKQPKVRNKPSGVMSLDDYLKQRESRGRA